MLYVRLRELREKGGKSQAEVASILGISRQHYALYEKGDRTLPIFHFVTLADYYGVTLDYLAGRSDSPS